MLFRRNAQSVLTEERSFFGRCSTPVQVRRLTPQASEHDKRTVAPLRCAVASLSEADPLRPLSLHIRSVSRPDPPPPTHVLPAHRRSSRPRC